MKFKKSLLALAVLALGTVTLGACNGGTETDGSGSNSGTGSNSFSPLEPYTREQCMMTTLRLFEQLG